MILNRAYINLNSITVYTAFLFLLIKLFVSPSSEDEMLEEIIKSNPISLMCDVVILFCFVVFLKRIHKQFEYLLYFFIFLLCSYAFSTYLNFDSVFPAIKSLLRVFVPLFFFALVCSYFYERKMELRKISFFIVLYILALAIIGLIMLPPSTNRWDGDNDGLWWPSYFNTIHTTTYVIISCFYIVFSLWSIGQVSKRIMIFMFFATFFSIAFGWGIRTTTLSLVLLPVAYFYFNYYSGNAKVALSMLIGGSLLTVFYINFLFDWEQVNALSSGRLSMYEFKYYQLIDNTLFAWIFGNGAGSDLVETDFWWWGAKDAHSDVISIIVEGGIVYLTSFVIIIYRLFKMFDNPAPKAIVVSIFVTALVSNGFFARPLALYLALLSLSLFYFSQKKGGRSA